jgi:hypothetical protein
MSDRDLAKVITTEEKEKVKKAAEKAEPAKKKTGYRPRYAPYPQWTPNHAQPAYQPAAQQPYNGGYQMRPDGRLCLNCRQPGHLFRNCPQRPPPPAALGAAPK